MKIIRWLLSHFFLILLIVAVIYGYMFWGNLVGEETPAGEALAYLSDEFVEVEEFINAVKAKQAKLSAGREQLNEGKQAEDEPAVGKPVVNKPVEIKPAENKQVAALPDTTKDVAETRDIEQLPVSISYSHNRMRVKQNSDGEIESSAELPVQAQAAEDSTQTSVPQFPITKPVSPTSQVNKSGHDSQQADENTAATEDNFVPTKLVQQLDKVDESGRITNGRLNDRLHGDAIRDVWITARKSFYQRKYELSEQSYQDVIDNTTDNFDAYGELGNVYFNQGKIKQATMAYFEAAAILVRKGQIRRAIDLQGILRRLDNNKANELKKLIDSAAP